MTVCSLENRHCQPCEGGVTPLAEAVCRARLHELPGWILAGPGLEKTFRFANHHEAVAFVNAVAWVSHREDHHPDLSLGYRDVRVRYWTHAIDGLSDNDFICAAKLEKLLVL